MPDPRYQVNRMVRQAGNLLRHWGGNPGGPGYEWFDQEHGLAVDHKGTVWIGGGAGGDSHLLKFTKDGKFLMQIGKRYARLTSGDPNGPPQQRVYTANSLDMNNFGRPAKIVVDAKSNEAYIADGYLNTRIVVLDADTGKVKRFWGAYGNKPDDSLFEKAQVTGDQKATGYDPAAPPAQQWRHTNSYRFNRRAVAAACSRSRHSMMLMPIQLRTATWTGFAQTFPARARVPVDVEVVPDERRQPFVHPRNRVGVVASHLSGPRSERRASLPSADVEQRDVARSRLHTGLPLPGFEVRPCDRCIGVHPVDAFQLRDVIQDGARGDAVLPVHHAALDASGLRRQIVFHRNAVVHHPGAKHTAN